MSHEFLTGREAEAEFPEFKSATLRAWTKRPAPLLGRRIGKRVEQRPYRGRSCKVLLFSGADLRELWGLFQSAKPIEQFSNAAGSWLRIDLAATRLQVDEATIYYWRANGCRWLGGKRPRMTTKPVWLPRTRRHRLTSFCFEQDIELINQRRANCPEGIYTDAKGTWLTARAAWERHHVWYDQLRRWCTAAGASHWLGRPISTQYVRLGVGGKYDLQRVYLEDDVKANKDARERYAVQLAVQLAAQPTGLYEDAEGRWGTSTALARLRPEISRECIRSWGAVGIVYLGREKLRAQRVRIPMRRSPYTLPVETEVTVYSLAHLDQALAARDGRETGAKPAGNGQSAHDRQPAQAAPNGQGDLALAADDRQPDQATGNGQSVDDRQPEQPAGKGQPAQTGRTGAPRPRLKTDRILKALRAGTTADQCVERFGVSVKYVRVLKSRYKIS